MPCDSGMSDMSAWNSSDINDLKRVTNGFRTELNKLTRIACEMSHLVDQSKLSQEAKTWVAHHEEVDRKRAEGKLNNEFKSVEDIMALLGSKNIPRIRRRTK